VAAFTVEAKQNSLKRQRTAETARMYNKARKSEIATRIKKVRGAAWAAREWR
jgi:ribosomal protein S20